MDAMNATRRPRQLRRCQTVTTAAARYHTVVVSLLLLVALLLSSTAVVDAGRRAITWPHATNINEPSLPTATTVDAAGDSIVCGCYETGAETEIGLDHAFYVTKFSARGHQIWRHEFLSTSGGGDACATAITSDTALDLYITGTVKSFTTGSEEMDVFVAKVSPLGALMWRHTLGTLYRDIATSIRAVTEREETGLIIGGYSKGTLSLGKASPPNCAPDTDSDASECDDGFVVKLSAQDGLVQWIRSVGGPGGKRMGETRVFDVGVGMGVATDSATSDGVLVVVGETHGELRSTQLATGRHAGNVFVRRLSTRTGETLWTTQLGASSICQLPASATSSSSYTRYYPRGRCALAIHTTSQELSIVASTYGLLSTFPSQKLQYATMCGPNTNTKSKPSACLQLVVARVQLATGTVQWVRQLTHASHTSAEAALAVSSEEEDLVVLGTASAGFFSSSAESMEQLLVMRLARDGVVQWTTELGLDGEDHAVAVARAGREQGEETESLFVLSHGSVDKTRRGQPSTQSSIQRIDARDGSVVPVCVDLVTFDKSQRVDVTRVSDPIATPSSIALRVQCPVRRDPVRLCADATASVGYRYRVVDSVSDDDDPVVVSTGRVHFARDQTTATLVVIVGPITANIRTRTLHVVLKPIEMDTQVESVAATHEWSIQLLSDDGDAVAARATTQGDAAADGQLWQQLTWLLLVVAVVVTVLVVVVGRLGCVGGAWRKAKVFQYKTLQMRRPSSSSSSPSSPTANTTTQGAATIRGVKTRARTRPLHAASVEQRLHQQPNDQREEDVEEEEETDELRSHLEEIQQLNQSLSGLLQQHQQQQQHGTGGTSASTSPRETTASARSPNIKKKNGWRRSTRALLPRKQCSGDG